MQAKPTTALCHTRTLLAAGRPLPLDSLGPPTPRQGGNWEIRDREVTESCTLGVFVFMLIPGCLCHVFPSPQKYAGPCKRKLQAAGGPGGLRRGQTRIRLPLFFSGPGPGPAPAPSTITEVYAASEAPWRAVWTFPRQVPGFPSLTHWHVQHRINCIFNWTGDFSIRSRGGWTATA